MLLVEIIKHTPLWVWALFAYILYRGVRALETRELQPSRMLILPAVFLLWGLSGIFHDLPDWPLAMVGFVVLGLVGLGLGWANGLRLPPARRDPATGLILRPGSATTLVVALFAFIAKYTLSVALAMAPTLGAQAGFALTFGGVSGLVAGIFWGGAALALWQAPRHALPAAPA